MSKIKCTLHTVTKQLWLHSNIKLISGCLYLAFIPKRTDGLISGGFGCHFLLQILWLFIEFPFLQVSFSCFFFFFFCSSVIAFSVQCVLFATKKKKPLFFLLHSPCKSVRSGKVTPRAQVNYFCLLLKKQLEVAEEEEKKKRDKQTAAILYQEHKKKDEKRKKKMLKDKKKTYIYIYIYIYNRKEKQLYVASKMVKEKRVMNRAFSLSNEAESRSCDSEGKKKKKSLDLRSCAQVTIRS